MHGLRPLARRRDSEFIEMRKLLKTSIFLIISTCFAWGVEPTLPQLSVDTTYAAPTGAVYAPINSAALSQVLAVAQRGDVIQLQAGSIYTGAYTLGERPAGTGYVHITTKDCPVLPGNRATPADANKMARVQTGNSYPVFQAKIRASYWRISCIEIVNSRQDVDATNLVNLQSSTTLVTPDDYPHHIILDRVLLHGNPGDKVRRAVRQGGRYQALIDSSCYDIRQPGWDTQCVSDSQGPGPYKVTNNYLEATTENLGYGGSNPSFPGVIPCDITVAGNHIKKDLSWQTLPADALGRKPLVKNWFELKAGCRVLVEGNVFENNWVNAQSGFGIVLTPANANMSNLAVEHCVYDVTIKNNRMLNTPALVNILGIAASSSTNNIPAKCKSTRMLFQNNWVEATAPGQGRVISYLGGPTDSAFINNTLVNPQVMGTLMMGGTNASTDLVFKGNIGSWGEYGFYVPPGTGATYASHYGPPETVASRLTGNHFIRTKPPVSAFPGANTWHASFELAVATPGAGANQAAIDAATKHSLTGKPYVALPSNNHLSGTQILVSELRDLVTLLQGLLP